MHILPNVASSQPDGFDALNPAHGPEYAGGPAMFNEMLGQAMQAGSREAMLESYQGRADDGRQALLESYNARRSQAQDYAEQMNRRDSQARDYAEQMNRRDDDPLDADRDDGQPPPSLQQLLDEVERRAKEDSDKEAAEAAHMLRQAMTGGDGEEIDAPQMLEMTAEDFEGLRKTLEESGFTAKEIAELEEAVTSESGLTWGEFMRRVAAKKLEEAKDMVFTPQQRQHLTHLLDKLGFTPQQTEEALGKLSQGELGEVLKQIHGKLQSMPEGKEVAFSRSEIQTLLDACRMPKQAQKKFMELFGEGRELKGEELRNALAQLKQDLSRMRKEAKQQTEQLMNDVSKALRKASDEAGDGRFTKRLMQADEQNQEKTIKQSAGVQKQIADDAEAARNSNQKPAAAKAEEAAKVEEAARKSVQAAPEKVDGKKASGQEAKSQNAGQQQTRTANLLGKGDTSQEHLGQDGGKGGQSRQDKDNLQELFSRFQQAPSDGKADKASNPATQNSMFEHLVKNAKSQAQSQSQSSEPLSRQAMRQVEQGVLKNMKNGGKQLTLQLKPESLGRLNVMLQVKNSEVRALIRAENPDTARMLAENMAALKSSLEQQGIKVSKVEVQTGMPEEQLSQQPFDQQRHNEARRQNELAQHLGRMRQMREESGVLAQEMQDGVEQARIAREGISIIA
jgi:flagellar hook-length control protein FliK